MRWLPWVGREMYEAVCAEKDARIAQLEADVAALRKRLDTPVTVNVTMPKQPATPDKPRKKKQPQSEFEQLPDVPTDYALCDENDARTVAALAAKKYGRRPYNVYELNVWVEGIKNQIRAAKAERARERRQEQQEVAETPQVELQTRTEMDEIDELSKNAPAHIRELILQAEGTGQ